jgi:hypothetical protein
VVNAILDQFLIFFFQSNFLLVKILKFLILLLQLVVETLLLALEHLVAVCDLLFDRFILLVNLLVTLLDIDLFRG